MCGATLPAPVIWHYREVARVKTQQERQADRRQAKLDEVQRQIDSGSLKVRQMTDEERERNQPRPPKPKQPKR
jgi:hypothetical protein